MMVEERGALLPGEMVREVLRRVPDERTLMQCKRVCKEWHSLISDPLFAMSRINLRLGTWRLGMLEMSNNNHNVTLCTYDSSANQGRLPIKMDRKFFDELYPLGRHYCDVPCLAGSCNGLLFIIPKPNRDAIILNPAMRSSTWIPPHNLNLRGRGIATGLGYDHTNGDYKAIVINFKTCGDIAMTVFSLRHHLWKATEHDQDKLAAATFIFRDKYGMTSTYYPATYFPYYTKTGHWYGTTVGGSPHWTGRRYSGTSTLIRFDVVSEEFMEVGLPAELPPEAEFEFGELLSLQHQPTGSSTRRRLLCVTFKAQNNNTLLQGWSKNIDIDDDESSSWTKLFSFTPKITFKTLKPVAAEQLILVGGTSGLASAGQVLMVLDRNLSLSKFNIKDNTREVLCVDLSSGLILLITSTLQLVLGIN